MRQDGMVPLVTLPLANHKHILFPHTFLFVARINTLVLFHASVVTS